MTLSNCCYCRVKLKAEPIKREGPKVSQLTVMCFRSLFFTCMQHHANSLSSFVSSACVYSTSLCPYVGIGIQAQCVCCWKCYVVRTRGHILSVRWVKVLGNVLQTCVCVCVFSVGSIQTDRQKHICSRLQSQQVSQSRQHSVILTVHHNHQLMITDYSCSHLHLCSTSIRLF